MTWLLDQAGVQEWELPALVNCPHFLLSMRELGPALSRTNHLPPFLPPTSSLPEETATPPSGRTTT